MEARLNIKPCKYCGGTGVIETQPFCSMDYSCFRAFPSFIHGGALYAIRCSCCKDFWCMNAEEGTFD